MQLGLKFVEALLEGSQSAQKALTFGEAWCITPMFGERLSEHMSRYGSKEMRSVTIQLINIDGHVAYPPKSEAAKISFEYRDTNESAWQVAEIAIVTAQTDESAGFLICEAPYNL